jgi:hypothetical protein
MKKPKLLLAALILLIGAASATAGRLTASAPNYSGERAAWPSVSLR